MERERESSGSSAGLQEDPSTSSATMKNLFDRWFVEKDFLLSGILKEKNLNLISTRVRDFRDTLFVYPDCQETRAEKAKYGLGPPEFLQSETADNPCDVKSALWTCIMGGHCHKERQTKILVRIKDEKHFSALLKKDFKRPDDAEVPVFLCVYHFTEQSKSTGKYLSALAIQHWFNHLTVPENAELRLTVRGGDRLIKGRRASERSEKLWSLLQAGTLVDDYAVCKMQGANAP